MAIIEKEQRMNYINDLLKYDFLFNSYYNSIIEHQTLEPPPFYKKYVLRLEQRGLEPGAVIYTSLNNLYKNLILYSFIALKTRIYGQAVPPEGDPGREIVKLYRSDRGGSCVSGVGISTKTAPSHPRSIKWLNCDIISEYVNSNLSYELFISDFCDVLTDNYKLKIQFERGRMD